MAPDKTNGAAMVGVTGGSNRRSKKLPWRMTSFSKKNFIYPGLIFNDLFYLFPKNFPMTLFFSLSHNFLTDAIYPTKFLKMFCLGVTPSGSVTRGGPPHLSTPLDKTRYYQPHL